MTNYNDRLLEDICNDILAKVPVKSIVLVGSRATGEYKENSDYDIITIMNTFIFPLYIRQLKTIERIYTKKSGNQITVNPLPVSIARRAKDSIFLLKARVEGITLKGEDHRCIITPVEISNISDDKCLSFLTSGLLLLCRDFSPIYLLAKAQLNEQLLQTSTRKAARFYVEARLLQNMDYATTLTAITQKFSTMRYAHTDGKKEQDARILQILNEPISDLLSAWSEVKSNLVDMFEEIVTKKSQFPIKNSWEAMTRHFQQSKSGLKNWQYFLYKLVVDKKLIWRAISTRHSVESGIQSALLLLLSSINNKGGIDKDHLLESWRILDNVTGIKAIKETEDPSDIWVSLKNHILNEAPFACTVLGV